MGHDEVIIGPLKELIIHRWHLMMRCQAQPKVSARLLLFISDPSETRKK
jgi:hypothetical protein